MLLLTNELIQCVVLVEKRVTYLQPKFYVCTCQVFQDYDARNQDISVDEGHCIWYGREPGDDADKINYAYSGPAKPLNDPDATAVLKNICPDLYKDVQGSTELHFLHLLHFFCASNIISEA